MVLGDISALKGACSRHHHPLWSTLECCLCLQKTMILSYIYKSEAHFTFFMIYMSTLHAWVACYYYREVYNLHLICAYAKYEIWTSTWSLAFFPALGDDFQTHGIPKITVNEHYSPWNVDRDQETLSSLCADESWEPEKSQAPPHLRYVHVMC